MCSNFFLPFSLLAGIFAFWADGLGSYWMKATASYSFEGLVAVALFEPAADLGRVSAKCVRVGWLETIEKTTIHLLLRSVKM